MLHLLLQVLLALLLRTVLLKLQQLLLQVQLPLKWILQLQKLQLLLLLL